MKKNYNTWDSVIGHHAYAVKAFIKDAINSGNNEHKLKMDMDSFMKVLNDEDTFPWYMFLGTGKTK